MKELRIKGITKTLSILSLVIPLLYIAYVILFKPTYITAPDDWNADKFWMYFSIRYWALGLIALSLLSSLFSIAAYYFLIKSKEKRMPWIIMQLVSPMSFVVGLVVCVLISSSGVLNIG